MQKKVEHKLTSLKNYGHLDRHTRNEKMEKWFINFIT